MALPEFAAEMEAVPHDYQAEEYLLRAILDPIVAADLSAHGEEYRGGQDDVIAIAAANVSPEDFMGVGFGAAYAATLRLFDRRQAIDRLTLRRELGEAIGPHPEEVLNLLFETVPCRPDQVAYYAALVRDLAMKRRAIQALGVSAGAFYDPKRSAQSALDGTRELLDGATRGLARGSGIWEVTDLSERLYDLYEHGSQNGWEVEWPAVSRLYRPQEGEWTLVTGIPSHGKSAFMDAVLVSLSQRYPELRFAVCSPENLPLERHLAKITRLFTGKPFDRGPRERMTLDELTGAQAWAYEHFTFVLPHENERSVPGVLAAIEGLMLSKRIDGVLIDPWNELDHSRPEHMSETEFISASLSKVRQFARRWHAHVWLVAHPAKLQRDLKTKNYPVPRPYDVSGSAHWFNKADNCLAIYRPDEGPSVEVHVQKVRFDQNGHRGVGRLLYDLPTGQYHSDPGDE